MKLALIGATGYTGSRILNEALNREHRLTTIVRDVAGLPSHPNLIPSPLGSSAKQPNANCQRYQNRPRARFKSF